MNRKIFILLLFWLSLGCFGASSEHENLAKQVIFRLHKTLDFLEKDYESVNLDGLFGIRISEGVFIKLTHKAKSNLFYYLLKKSIQSFNHRISYLAKKVHENLVYLSVEYIHKFNRLVERPFVSKTKIDTGLLDDHLLKINFKKNDTFNEKLSDLCYSQLINGNYGDLIEPLCFEFFTTDGTSGYSLTHQLLFFVIADNFDRFDDVTDQLLDFLTRDRNKDRLMTIYLAHRRGQRLNDIIFKYFCTRIYHDANNLFVNFTNANEFKQDLFIEQIVLCGSLGFDEFFDPKWLELIFTFQNKNGCFNQRENRYDLNLKNVGFSKILSIVDSKRTKRYDSLMKDGCSSHQTGLALAYFSLFLDFLL